MILPVSWLAKSRLGIRGTQLVAAYYNEFDPFAAAWLRELIKDGLIADGEVDERSIKEVTGSDLTGFTQCHFFAGIGGWSLALRIAGWSDDRPVWTGSCPCQPFSDAGQRQGEADPRHLWPDLRRLITECRPSIVFGEQVASQAGRVWLAGVFADLEALAYQRAGADLCAAGVGAPHIRQRLYWMADADQGQRGGIADRQEREFDRAATGRQQSDGEPQSSGADGGLHHTAGARQQPARPGSEDQARHEARMRGPERGRHQGWGSTWVECSDGKSRRFEPGIQPLAHGVPNRVGTLRGSGNAIVPALAAEFIAASVEAMTSLQPL